MFQVTTLKRGFNFQSNIITNNKWQEAVIEKQIIFCKVFIKKLYFKIRMQLASKLLWLTVQTSFFVHEETLASQKGQKNGFAQICSLQICLKYIDTEE